MGRRRRIIHQRRLDSEGSGGLFTNVRHTTIPKAGFVYREGFSTLHELQVEPNGCVHRCNHFRLHSKLGYVSPVEFGNAGLSL